MQGEVATVKLLTCPLDGESMKMVYTSEFRKDVNGDDIEVSAINAGAGAHGFVDNNIMATSYFRTIPTSC